MFVYLCPISILSWSTVHMRSASSSLRSGSECAGLRRVRLTKDGIAITETEGANVKNTVLTLETFDSYKQKVV